MKLIYPKVFTIKRMRPDTLEAYKRFGQITDFGSNGLFYFVLHLAGLFPSQKNTVDVLESREDPETLDRLADELYTCLQGRGLNV